MMSKTCSSPTAPACYQSGQESDAFDSGALLARLGYLFLLKDYGIAAFGVLYVTIILRAFKDTIFQGLLCLIPLYPFYYIILVCDDFYLRAVVAGTMVGVG